MPDLTDAIACIEDEIAYLNSRLEDTDTSSIKPELLAKRDRLTAAVDYIKTMQELC